MTTSGVVTFNRTRNEIIHHAGRKVGAWAAGETVGAQAVADFAEALNIMVKHWQGQGIQIWRTTEAVLFLAVDQASYSLGSTATDHSTESFVETALATAEAASSTSLGVSSIVGISSGDQIGIELDDGTMHWTTVNGAPAGSTVVITTGLASAAAIGNRVVTYTTQLVRPLQIISARRYNFDSAIDTPVDVQDRIEYQELPNKTSGGPVNGIYYDRRGGANGLGLLYAWPRPDSVNDCIKMTVARPIQDFTVAGDNADVPTEWLQALIWNLALQMAPEFDVPPNKFSMIEKMADKYIAEVTWSEGELTTVEFMPARRR